MRKKIGLTTILILSIILFQTSLCVLASAGGSSGGSGGSGGGSSGGSGGSYSSSSDSESDEGGTLVDNVISVFVLIAMFGYPKVEGTIKDKADKYKEKKNAKSVRSVDKYTVEKLLIKGNLSSEEEFNKRVEDIYYKVQEAWTERNISIAAGYISGKLFWKYSKRIDEMLNISEVNILEDIEFSSSTIKKVKEDGIIIVKVKGTLIDYWLDTSKNIIKKGSSRRKRKLRENWKFVIQEGEWVLDDIL